MDSDRKLFVVDQLVWARRQKENNQSIYVDDYLGNTYGGGVFWPGGEESIILSMGFRNYEKEVGSLGITALLIVFGEGLMVFRYGFR